MAIAAKVTELERAVLDSSVVIKWFREGEAFREEALLLRQSYLEGKLRLAVPDLLFYEIANVLRYKRNLNAGHVQAAMQSLFDMRLERIPVTPELISRAVELAYEHDVTVYDAVFITSAEQLRAVLITADEKLIDKASPHARVRFLGDVG